MSAVIDFDEEVADDEYARPFRDAAVASKQSWRIDRPHGLQSLTDEELFARHKDGCRRSLAILYERYNNKLLRRVMPRLQRNFDLAEEVASNTWISVAKSKHAPACFPAWLFWRARFEVASVVRRESRQSERKRYFGQKDDERDDKPIGEPSIRYDDRLSETEQCTQLQMAVAALPETLRQVVRLVFFAGMSYRTVAKQLGTSHMAVSSRVKEATLLLGWALTRVNDHRMKLANESPQSPSVPQQSYRTRKRKARKAVA